MSDLVGNPEDRFSHNEAQIKTNGGTTERVEKGVLQSNVITKISFYKVLSKIDENGYKQINID